jgi:hypothetical protein
LRDSELSPANGTIPQNPLESYEKKLVRTDEKQRPALPKAIGLITREEK